MLTFTAYLYSIIKFLFWYFGNGDYATCIDYLQRIINEHGNLRTDLQCYARLLHLMAHYELGNDAIIESLARSGNPLWLK